MASVEVTGVVGNVGWEGRRISLWETYDYTFKDSTVEKKRLWTIWFDHDAQLEKNTEITVKGILATKMDTYEAKDGTQKTAVAHSMNFPKIVWQGVAPLVDTFISPEINDLPF